jgi:hypothetical protein
VTVTAAGGAVMPVNGEPVIGPRPDTVSVGGVLSPSLEVASTVSVRASASYRAFVIWTTSTRPLVLWVTGRSLLLTTSMVAFAGTDPVIGKRP